MAWISGWGYEEEGLHTDEILFLGRDSGGRQFQTESKHWLIPSFLQCSLVLQLSEVGIIICSKGRNLKFGYGLELEFTPGFGLHSEPLVSGSVRKLEQVSPALPNPVICV